jgi:acyl-CoA thioester hydrolase
LSLPTYADALALPTWAEAAVDPSHIDANGHMNVRFYLEYTALGTAELVEDLGITDAYRGERRMGLFTAEHHLRYFSELHEGDKLSVHVRVLDRGARSAHMMAFLLDRTRERLSCTLELTIVHVDMDTRRPVPFPEDIAAGFDRWVDASGALGWLAPVCGAMGVRR